MGDVLFLAHRVPWPPDRGDKIRSYHILRELARHAVVHVGTFAESVPERDAAVALDKVAGELHVELRTLPNWRAGLRALRRGSAISIEAFASPMLRDWVERAIARFEIDTIFVFSGQMVQYIPASFAGRVIVDFVDVDSAKFAAYAESGPAPLRWVNAREARLLAKVEATAARRADASLLVSEPEAALFRQRTSADTILSIGNGIDVSGYDPAAPAPHAVDGLPLILFTGQMDYRPNVEAVVAFVREAMPLILRRHPAARFAIVGRAPSAAVRALAGEAVIVTGEVADVRPWLASATVVVAPLLIARGVQNKVLEAMAMGCAVVASQAAAEGIDATAGRDLIVAASMADQAHAVSDLIANEEQRHALGTAARALVATDYRWDARLAPLRALMGWQAAAPEIAA